ncbi:MAG: sugar phosphate isomerase/epimerase [Kiritimatiellae bacterium]|nr:sugar phosphate isomerase/epimerase [Kiritimatiellia bacterium]
MKTCGEWPIALCSWSLTRKVGDKMVPLSVDEIGSVMNALGLEYINLAIGPALDPVTGPAYLEAVRRQNWKISAGMMAFDYEDYTTLDTIKATGGIAPDDKWPASGEAFAKAAKIAAELGTKYIAMHVGFLNESDSAYAKKFFDRVRYLGDAAKDAGLTLLMETGQETADDLLHFVETLNHENVRLNLDPANLILYNKDEPIPSVKKLAPYIRHVHIKDAIRTKVPGTWGQEVTWGDGEVNSFAFLNALRSVGYQGCLAIEREAGEQRVTDIATAVRRLQAW